MNSLIRMRPTAVDDLKLEWADIPIERDARIVAKRVALDLYGEEPVHRYIDQRSAEAGRAARCCRLEFCTWVDAPVLLIL